MPDLNLVIPQAVVDSLRLPPARVEEELRHEFAVFLVKEGLLSRAQARSIAHMERLAFEELLRQRHVSWGGTPEDVLGDLESAKAAARPKAHG